MHLFFLVYRCLIFLSHVHRQTAINTEIERKKHFFLLLGKGIDCEEDQFKCTNVNTNAILSINQWNRYIHGGRLVQSQYCVLNLRERGFHRVRALLAGKVFCRTVQDCTLSLVYLYRMYSVLGILPRINCTQVQ